MNKFDYAKEKIDSAIYSLATGENDIRTRLVFAAKKFHTLLHDGHLPPELHLRFLSIWRELTKFNARYVNDKEREGPVEHTMKRIKKKTGRRIAEDIMDLRTELNNF